jgi:ribosome maturation factor RimP
MVLYLPPGACPDPVRDWYEVGLTPTFFVGGRFIDQMRGTRSTSAASAPDPLPTGSSRSLHTLTPEIETELAEIASAAGCELIHVEWKGGVLRLILDRPFRPAAPQNLVLATTATTAAGTASGTTAAAATAPANPRTAAAAADAAAPAPPELPEPLETLDSREPRESSGGVSLGDCELVAKQASAVLDLIEFGNGRYVLEVSSPGLDRELYRPSDYQRFVGRLARVTYDAPGPGGRPAKRTVVARLAAATPAAQGALEVTLADDRTGERFTLGLDSIRRARLEIEL